MATFRARQSGEDLGAYLKAKQAFELAQTGKSSITFKTPQAGAGATPTTPTPPPNMTPEQQKAWDVAVGLIPQQPTTPTPAQPSIAERQPTIPIRQQAIQYLKDLGYTSPDEKEIQEAITTLQKYPTPAPTPTAPTTPTSTYTGVSIVDYLKSIGQPSDITSRIALGKQYGIDYSKSTTDYAAENTQLLNLLKSGTQPTPPKEPEEPEIPKEPEEPKEPELPPKENGTPIDTDKLNADWQKKFDEMTAQFEKTQEEATKKTEDILTKMGETATAETLAKFEETQKGIMEAYQTYFDQQSDYLADLQAQPSAVENLQKFREEQGLPQMEKELAGIDQIILDTENLLLNVEQDIRARTEGLPVTEAAARRLQAMESKPLTTQLTELIRGRQRVAAGLEAKQATVSQFMTAQEADIERQREIAGERLGFAKEKAEVIVDIRTQSFNLFTDLQDKIFEIDKLRIDVVQNEADYKNALTEAGFNFFTQMMAEQKADIKDKEKFEQELVKIQLEQDLANQNPEYRFETKTDANGNVFMIQTNKATGATDITNLGPIGKGTTEDKEDISQSNMARELQKVRGADGYISPESWKKAKEAWINEGFDPEKFIKAFYIYINPADPQDYGSRESDYLISDSIIR